MSHAMQRLLALLVVSACLVAADMALVHAGGFGPAQGSGGGGSGGLSGLGSTDNALVRTDGTSGDRVQGSTVTVDDSGGGALRVGTYTVATLPSASTAGAGTIVYVSNGAAGSPVLAFSDGTNWLRCDTLAAVSDE